MSTQLGITLKSVCVGLTESKECVLRGHEDEHSAQYVLVDDVVLDVVRVMFHAERQQLHYQSQQLARLKVIWDTHTHTHSHTHTHREG